MTEIINSIESINSRMDQVEERSYELEDFEIIYTD